MSVKNRRYGLIEREGLLEACPLLTCLLPSCICSLSALTKLLCHKSSCYAVLLKYMGPSDSGVNHLRLWAQTNTPPLSWISHFVGEVRIVNNTSCNSPFHFRKPQKETVTLSWKSVFVLSHVLSPDTWQDTHERKVSVRLQMELILFVMVEEGLALVELPGHIASTVRKQWGAEKMPAIIHPTSSIPSGPQPTGWCCSQWGWLFPP